MENPTHKKWYRKSWVQYTLAILLAWGVFAVVRSRNPGGLSSVPVSGYTGPASSMDSASIATASQNLGEEKPAPVVGEERERLIRGQFSSWDGSHRGMVKAVKKAMNDPESFEHEETSYVDNGDYLTVRMTYRGRNAYGGKVLNAVQARVDFEGNVLEIAEAR